MAIVSLTSCEGCQVALLDLGKRFFDFAEKVNLLDFHLIEESPAPKGKIDVIFVEGNPITKEDLEILKKARAQAKILIALGNCAALGGIPEMKNYKEKEKTIRYIYKTLSKVINPDIKEINNFVKVDFTIPGCPINNEEFLRVAEKLIKNEFPKAEQKPVCSECPLLGKPECFLRKKEPCFGALSPAGCEAICPKNNFLCYGCRGIREKANVKSLLKTLYDVKSKEEIDENLEIFGLRDMIEK